MEDHVPAVLESAVYVRPNSQFMLIDSQQTLELSQSFSWLGLEPTIMITFVLRII